ncbi:MAG: hypothetical protein AUG51_25750 [Acidobacteria bacterium 13_1_20CM_3_53_8]|nr:MAG: hypothetical protein AUG51_25750 [Acidobacteria bacterium 13_1_20CM_3_53_8]
MTALLALSQSGGSALAQNNDEAALNQLVHELADAIVKRDFTKLNALREDFTGNAQGRAFNKRMLQAALQSGEMQVASWEIFDVKVKFTSKRTAIVTGRSRLTDAKYQGLNFSGEWEWTDNFLKQRDGNWRLISSRSRIINR